MEQPNILLQYIYKYVQPTDAELEAFISGAEFFEYDPNGLILEAGQVAQYVYFILNGAVKHEYKGRDVKKGGSIWLSFENDLLTDVYSFFAQEPSLNSLVALTKVQLLGMKHSFLQDLYSKYHVWERFGRLTAQHYVLMVTSKNIDMQLKLASERYKELIERRPSILQELSLGQIASYLGITQEALSRIRGKKLK